MTDLLLQIAIGNVCISLALAIVAVVVESTLKRPQLAHLLWLLVFVKLVTPPVVSIPGVTVPRLTDNTTVVIQDHSQLDIDGQRGPRETRPAMLEQAKVVLSLIWVLGSLFVFAWSLVRVFRFNRLLGMESEVAPHALRIPQKEIQNDRIRHVKP